MTALQILHCTVRAVRMAMHCNVAYTVSSNCMIAALQDFSSRCIFVALHDYHRIVSIRCSTSVITLHQCGTEIVFQNCNFVVA